MAVLRGGLAITDTKRPIQLCRTRIMAVTELDFPCIKWSVIFQLLAAVHHYVLPALGATSRFTVVSSHPNVCRHPSVSLPDFVYTIFPTVFLGRQSDL